MKTTALAVLLAVSFARLRGRRHVALFRWALPEGTVQRTTSLVLLSFALVTAAVLLLTYTEDPGGGAAAARGPFPPLMFEAMSAFGTVGLSMDLTPLLSDAGKLVIIGLMFVGRVGPFALFAAISLRGTRYPADMRPAQEDLIVG